MCVVTNANHALSISAISNGSAVNADKEQSYRDQELALIKPAELYRDQKWVLQSLLFYASLTPDRDASGLAQVITLSRSFMSSTDKAKTTKLNERLMFLACYTSLMSPCSPHVS